MTFGAQTSYWLEVALDEAGTLVPLTTVRRALPRPPIARPRPNATNGFRVRANSQHHSLRRGVAIMLDALDFVRNIIRCISQSDRYQVDCLSSAYQIRGDGAHQ